MSAGIATDRPAAVVISASEIPPAKTPGDGREDLYHAYDRAEQAEQRRNRSNRSERIQISLELVHNVATAVFDALLDRVSVGMPIGKPRREQLTER